MPEKFRTVKESFKVSIFTYSGVNINNFIAIRDKLVPVNTVECVRIAQGSGVSISECQDGLLKTPVTVAMEDRSILLGQIRDDGEVMKTLVHIPLVLAYPGLELLPGVERQAADGGCEAGVDVALHGLTHCCDPESVRVALGGHHSQVCSQRVSMATGLTVQ